MAPSLPSPHFFMMLLFYFLSSYLLLIWIEVKNRSKSMKRVLLISTIRREFVEPFPYYSFAAALTRDNGSSAYMFLNTFTLIFDEESKYAVLIWRHRSHF